MMLYLGMLFGILTGVGLALLIVTSWMKRSNDIGDSTGVLEDFGEVTVLYAKKGMKDKNFDKSRTQLNGMEVLRDRRHEMVIRMREAENVDQSCER